MARMARRRSTTLWIIGAVLTAAGFGVVLSSIFRDQARVADFVRVPAGCVTTFETAESGRYYVYLERRGRIDDIGDCSNDEREFDVAEPETPVLTWRDGGNDADFEAPLVLPVTDPASYDLPDFSGRAVAVVDLEARVAYSVVLDTDDPATVVAIGERVVPVESGLAIGGAITVMGGGAVLVAALIVTVTSRRRRTNGPWAPPDPSDRAVF